MARYRSPPLWLLRRSMQIARRAGQSLATRSASALAFAVASSRQAHTPLRDLADTVVAHAFAQLAAYVTDNLETPKIHPRRYQNEPSGGPKSSQNRPGSVQERPRAPKSAPRAPQERPKSAQERPKSLPRAPKSALRAPKSAPRVAQERPETPQRPLGTPF